MHTPRSRKRPVSVVLVLLLMAVLLDKFLVTNLFPSMPPLLGIDLMVVFLDIPVSLPAVVDLVPVWVIFSFFYSVFVLSREPRPGWKVLRKKLRTILMGLTLLLGCLAAGGLIFYFSADMMTREVRNGIDSIGMRADLYSPWPGHEVIHLRGSLIMLVTGYGGMLIFIHLIRRAGRDEGTVAVAISPGNIEPAAAGNGEPPARMSKEPVPDPPELAIPMELQGWGWQSANLQRRLHMEPGIVLRTFGKDAAEDLLANELPANEPLADTERPDRLGPRPEDHPVRSRIYTALPEGRKKPVTFLPGKQPA